MIQEQAASLFEEKRGLKPAVEHQQPEIAVQRDRQAEDGAGLTEKSWDQSVMERRSWIDPDEEILPMRIGAVTRSMADARHLFYGSQRMVIFLKRKRHEVNRKRA